MDIDIDFPSTFTPTSLFKQAVPASMVRKGELAKHPCGHYFQHMPVDEVTNFAAIPYDKAEELGFTKIDFLHLHILDHFQSKRELRALMKAEPDWSLLTNATIVEQLFQLHRNHQLLCDIQPTSVQELADCIALIRPSKKHLIPAYSKASSEGRAKLRLELYTKPSGNQPWFKKAHAIAYALTIVLQLHLLKP